MTLSVEGEARENINSEVDENNIYDIDNMSLDKNKEIHKRSFESKAEYIYDNKIQNGITCIHGKKVNIIAECYLLHDILNSLKRTKN